MTSERPLVSHNSLKESLARNKIKIILQVNLHPYEIIVIHMLFNCRCVTHVQSFQPHMTLLLLIYIFGTVSEKIASRMYNKSFKNASRLSRYNFRTVKAIGFLFSKLYDTPFLCVQYTLVSCTSTVPTLRGPIPHGVQTHHNFR